MPKNKIFISSIIAGIIGAILIFILVDLNLNLGFLTGYLFIITASVSILLAHRIYKKLSALPSSYWKRVLVGTITYIIFAVCYTLRQILRNQYQLYERLSDYFPIVLFHISFALILSLILSIRISRNITTT
jgi:peptidoglycan/LPS O-acetylase OafA/YrhL